MKNRLFLSLILLIITILPSFSQYQSEIGGTPFTFELNEENLTATIVDRNHRIDDAKYPIYADRRKIKHLKGDNKHLMIPEAVVFNGRVYTITGIGRAAFADFTNFTSVTIPSTVVYIGDYAFFRTQLEEITIPESVKEIGDRVFGYCEKLKRMDIPKALTIHRESYQESAKTLQINRYDSKEVAQHSKDGYLQIEDKGSNWVMSDLDMELPTTTNVAENTFVAIIANENYENDPKVDFAIQDGQTFRNYCERILGVPAAHIRMKENATYNNMRGIINWMRGIAETHAGKARFIFYYSGHGSQGENEVTSLLPIDGSSLDEESGYDLNTLYKALGEMPSQHVCVFLDACFSGKQRNDELLVATRGARIAFETAPIGNMVVLSAAQEKETAFSYPEKGHGLFSYFLLKKLKESRGEVTLGELSDYIEKNVGKTSRMTMNAKQTPSTSISPTFSHNWRKIKLNE